MYMVSIAFGLAQSSCFAFLCTPGPGTVQANRQLRELREIAKGVTKQLPGVIQNATAKIDEYARGMISGTGSTLFEELGFYYIGPVDGHNLQDLIDVLSGKRRGYTAQ